MVLSLLVLFTVSLVVVVLNLVVLNLVVLNLVVLDLVVLCGTSDGARLDGAPFCRAPKFEPRWKWLVSRGLEILLL